MTAEDNGSSYRINWIFRPASDDYDAIQEPIVSPIFEIIINHGFMTKWQIVYQGDIECFDWECFTLKLIASDAPALNIKHCLKAVGDYGENFSPEFRQRITGRVVLVPSIIDHERSRNVRVRQAIFDGSKTVIYFITIKPFASLSSNSDHSCFRRMFEQKLFCDFKVKSKDGKIFEAHKNVLATRSTVFESMLNSECESKESKDNLLFISDYDSIIVKELLRFIYYREVENINEIAHTLIYAADKYLLNGLKKFCIKNLIRKVANDNLIEFLKICDQLEDTERLFNACFDFVTCNRHILSSNEWKEVPTTMQLKFINRLISSCNNKDLTVHKTF